MSCATPILLPHTFYPNLCFLPAPGMGALLFTTDPSSPSILFKAPMVRRGRTQVSGAGAPEGSAAG